MIVPVCQGDFGYYIPDCIDFGDYAIDVTQKFVDRYKACEAEFEFIQSKLHKYYTEAKEKHKQEAYNKMPKREAKGFD